MAKKKNVHQSSPSNPPQPKAFQLRKIIPKTPGQKDIFESWEDGYHLVVDGMAGTGKSFCAMYLALRDGFHVKVIRSAVSVRTQGFLPGNIKEKMRVFEEPYRKIAADLYGRGDAWDVLVQKGLVSFDTTSYLRGLTYDGMTIIVDEVQNMSYEELKSIITRVGNDTRIIFAGDIGQNDLIFSKYDQSGWIKFKAHLEKLEEFDIVTLRAEDVVRSGVVRSFLFVEAGLDPKNFNKKN